MFWNREKRKRTADEVIKQLRKENRELLQQKQYAEQLLQYIMDKANAAAKDLDECPEYQRKMQELVNMMMMRPHLITPSEALRILEGDNE